MKNLDIVITMGGLGSRFRKAGYTVPKFMIETRGKTLFEWSILSLKGFADCAARYIFIAMRDESADVETFIAEQCKALGIADYKLLLLDYLTDGQATTAELASKYWNPEHGLLIYNIDTYVVPGAMNAAELKGDGFIPCFLGEGDHWSFVRLDESSKAVEVREKTRISENCTLGAYYFKSCALYEKLYREFYADNANLEKGEKYIAPMYNYLIQKGGEVYISVVPTEAVHVLGTPEEVKAFEQAALD